MKRVCDCYKHAGNAFVGAFILLNVQKYCLSEYRVCVHTDKFFVCLFAPRVSHIDPPMAVCIISREGIYNMGWGGECREQALEVPGRSWGSGESSATGETLIKHVCFPRIRLFTSAPGRTSVPGQSPLDTTPDTLLHPLITAAELQLAAGLAIG